VPVPGPVPTTVELPPLTPLPLPPVPTVDDDDDVADDVPSTLDPEPDTVPDPLDGEGEPLPAGVPTAPSLQPMAASATNEARQANRMGDLRVVGAPSPPRGDSGKQGVPQQDARRP